MKLPALIPAFFVSTSLAQTPAADTDPARIADAAAHQPIDITEKTRADAKSLAALEKPGEVLFKDDFESADSLKSYFEVLGLKEGRAKVTDDPKLAHAGRGALQLTTPDHNGAAVGAGPSYWFGPEGRDTVHLRYYLKFADGYDQGDLNHTGASLAATSGREKWDGMGNAGLRPRGDDRFTIGFEPWRDWHKNAAPGVMHVYTYWQDMKQDKDGHYWGSMFMPREQDRINPPRGEWHCYEQMIKANTPGKDDGQLAAWIDGNLYLHMTGLRWRATDSVKLKRFALSIYVHKSVKENTVWYDDVVLSTGYVGPTTTKPAAAEEPASKK